MRDVQNEPESFALEPADTGEDHERPLLSVPLWKLIVLSIVTMSFYHLVWFYRQWKRQQSVEHCSPFLRSLFGGISFLLLATRVKQRRVAHGLAPGFSPIAAGLAYLLINVVANLMESGWIFYAMSFLPLLPAQHLINQMNAEIGSPEPVDRFGGGAVLATMFGGLLWLLVLADQLLPAPVEPHPVPAPTEDIVAI